MTLYRAENVSGSSKKNKCPKCNESWIEHWRINMGRKSTPNRYCAAYKKNKSGKGYRCRNTADVGAHVYLHKSEGEGFKSDGIEYIILLCCSCNKSEKGKNKDGKFKIDPSVYKSGWVKANECIKSSPK